MKFECFGMEINEWGKGSTNQYEIWMNWDIAQATSAEMESNQPKK